MATKAAGRQQQQQQQQPSQKDSVNGVIVSFDSDDSEEEEEGRSSSASSAELSSADEPSSEDELPPKPVKKPPAAPVSAKQELKNQPIQPDSDEESSESEDGEVRSTTGNAQANGGGPALTYSLTLQPSVVTDDSKNQVDNDSDVDEEVVNVFAKKQATQKDKDVTALPQLETANTENDKINKNSKAAGILAEPKKALPDVAITEQQSKSSTNSIQQSAAENTATNGENSKKLPTPDITVDRIPCNGKPEVNHGDDELENGHPQSVVANVKLNGSKVEDKDTFDLDQKPKTKEENVLLQKEDSSDLKSAKKSSAEASEKQDAGQSEEKKVGKKIKKPKREKPSTKSDDVQTELLEKPDLLQNDVRSTPTSEKSMTTIDTTSNSAVCTGGQSQPDVTGSSTNKQDGDVEKSVNQSSEVDALSGSNGEQPVAACVAISVEKIKTSEEPVLVSTTRTEIGEDEKETRDNKKQYLTIDRPSNEAGEDGEQIESTSGLVNEESDYSFRRRSIDDFIRKILEEARLEQKKRMDNIQVEPEKPTLPLSSSSLPLEPETPARASHLIKPEADNLPTDDVTGTLADVVPPADVNSKQPDVMSMLDRRLASTERKREETERQLKTDGDGIEGTEFRATSILSRDDSFKSESKFSAVEPTKYSDNESVNTARRTVAASAFVTAKTDEDLDQELADIGRYFAKRTPLNVDEIDDAGQEEDIATGWLKVRPIAKPFNYDNIENDLASVDDVGTDQPPMTGRRFSIEEFVPQRRAETDEIIRNKMRPVRGLIDQQTDIIQRLKVVGRDISGLEEEIRQLRQRCIVDRQSFFNSLGSAVADELRLYEVEQRAADERMAKQVPFARFVREQFVATNMSTTDARLVRNRPPIPPLSSVGSGSGGSYFASASVGSDFRRAQSVAPSNDGDVYGWNRRDTRAGSVSRETSLPRFSVEESTKTTTTRRPVASVNLTSNYSSSRRPSAGEDDDIEEVIRRSRQARANSVGPGAFYSSFSAESTENKAFTSSRPSAANSSEDYSERRRSRTSIASSSSEDQTSTPRYFRRYSVAVEDTSGAASRFARRGSIGDYGGSSNSSRGTSGGEFQSKFLDKVRQRRALGLDNSSSSASSTDKPFQSRFLRSSSSSDTSSERRYSTTT